MPAPPSGARARALQLAGAGGVHDGHAERDRADQRPEEDVLEHVDIGELAFGEQRQAGREADEEVDDAVIPSMTGGVTSQSKSM